MLNTVLLLVGFILLIKGADVFVDSSSSIARKFKIPSIIIGMTIVAMGTSAPELSVSIQSALAGLNDMSVANVVGSNIFNILAVLGVSSLFNKLKIKNYTDVFTLLGISALLLCITINRYLSVFNGAILLLVFIYFIYRMINGAKDNKEEIKEQTNKPLWLTIILGILGLSAIIYGGNLVVSSASAIAITLGMSENLVGLTIVAIGTSLPELVTSVMATKKGEVDIAVGNVIGSNIFNILLILGVTSVLNPIVITPIALLDIFIMTIVTVIFILTTQKKKEVNKVHGCTFIIMYIVYIIFSIIR